MRKMMSMMMSAIGDKGLRAFEGILKGDGASSNSHDCSQGDGALSSCRQDN